MRHLDRNAVPAPTCLARYKPGADRWDALTREDREEIRAQLGILQKMRCAYCECDLQNESHDPHLEHFEQRSRALAKTFSWYNIFWSCTRPDRCGKRKDSVVQTYNPADLLKPDVDDPRAFLFFTSEGGVEPRVGLGAVARRRAEETIRVFALDHPSLVAMRKAYLAGPHGELQQLREAGFSPDEAREFVQDLLNAYADVPFSAAVLDVLGVAP